MNEDENSQALVVFNFSRLDGLRDESRHFTFARRSFVLHQAYKSDSKGGTDIGFGGSVYNGAFVLSSFLESVPDLIIDKNCIEIGCGPGLVSIAALALGANKVVCTDGDPISVDLAQLNIEKNCTAKEIHRGKIVTKKLFWGNIAEIRECESLLTKKCIHGSVKEKRPQFDVVLAADVVAYPYKEAFGPLVETFEALASERTVIYLCYQRRHRVEDEFFEKLKRHNFHTEAVERDFIHPDFRSNPVCMVSIFKISRSCT